MRESKTVAGTDYNPKSESFPARWYAHTAANGEGRQHGSRVLESPDQVAESAVQQAHRLFQMRAAYTEGCSSGYIWVVCRSILP